MPQQMIRLRQVKRHWPIYVLLLPSVLMIATFLYYPALSGVYHAFFEWDGDEIAVPRGLDNFARALKDPTLLRSFGLVGILFLANLFKMIPSIVTAVVIHRIRNDRARYTYRLLFVVPMVIPWMVSLLMWKFFYNPQVGLLNRFLSAVGILGPGQTPAWLSDPKLMIPALIFWGFPWIGIIGVLIYLSGLERIPKSVYECAELDGVGWLRKFLYIEMPLIATQIRITLILSIIGVIKGYGMILVLFKADGGPGGRAMVPGLYMYERAFMQREAGYACAIGILLFFIIVILTYINNKYVRVKK